MNRPRAAIRLTKLVFLLVMVGLLHLALTPVESQDGGGVPFALMLRLGALVAISVIAFFSTRVVFVARVQLVAFCLLFLSLFVISNLLSGAFPVLMFAVLSVVVWCGAVINSAVESSWEFRVDFITVLGLLMGFWIASFLVQAVWYYLSGEVLQLHGVFSPFSVDEQRAQLLSSGLARLGGAHIEPGTYVNWLFGVILVKALYQGRLFDKANSIGCVTMPASMSFWGVIAFCFSAVSYLLSERRKSATYIKLMFFLLLAVYVIVSLDVWSVAYEYFETRSQGEDESTEAKLDGYAGFFANLAFYWLIGAGADFDFCSGCLSPQDSGVLVNLVVQIGLLPAVAVYTLIFLGFYRRLGVAGVLVLIPSMISKWYYWDPVFILLLCAGVSAAWSRNRSRTDGEG